VQERTLDVEVIVTAAHEHQGDGAIDHDAKRCDPDHGCGFDRLRIGKAPQRFDDNTAGGKQKQSGIAEGGQDRRAAVAVGPAGARTAACQRGRAPGQQQPDHIGEIMRGVGHQGQRIRQITESQFGEYDNDVEPDPDGKRTVEIGRCVAMAMAVIMVMVVMMHVCHRSLFELACHKPHCNFRMRRSFKSRMT
jgi:hypothetical protein